VDIPTEDPTPEVAPGNDGDKASNGAQGGFVENNLLFIAIAFAGLFMCTLFLFVVYCVHQKKKQRGLNNNERVIPMSNLGVSVPAVSPSAEGNAMTTTFGKSLSNAMADPELPDEDDSNEEDEADENVLYSEMVAPTQGASRSSSEEAEMADNDGMYTVPIKSITKGGAENPILVDDLHSVL